MKYLGDIRTQLHTCLLKRHFDTHTHTHTYGLVRFYTYEGKFKELFGILLLFLQKKRKLRQEFKKKKYNKIAKSILKFLTKSFSHKLKVFLLLTWCFTANRKGVKIKKIFYHLQFFYNFFMQKITWTYFYFCYIIKKLLWFI